ncbi:MAG: PorT family protein [Reichenbachiella sp.]
MAIHLKGLVLFALVLISFSSVHSLPRVGLKLNYGLATVNGIDSADNSIDDIGLTYSYAIGAMALFVPTKDINIETDLLYLRRGYGKSDGPFSLNVSLHYIAVPILIHYKIHNFSIMVGPEFSYYLFGKAEFDLEGTIDPELIKIQKPHPYDVGIIVGASIRNSGNLIADVRMSHGFYSIDISPEHDDAFYNFTLGLSLGILY